VKFYIYIHKETAHIKQNLQRLQFFMKMYNVTKIS